MKGIATIAFSFLLSVQAGETNMAEVEALQKRVHDLGNEIKRLTAQMKTEKYGLRWVECPEAFEAESENKIPILAEVPEKAIKNKDGKPTHILIEGDNYHALTCLNFTHRGKIDVIYIDPPYNTGSDGFTYKDKRYLDKYPDGEKIDKNHPLRHSAWLSFMSKRLRLAKDLLSDRGVIFISIDDNEMANLKLLCDDPKMFGEKNFIGHLTWESTTQPINAGKARFELQKKVESILCYAKDKSRRESFVLQEISTKLLYPHNGRFGKCRFEIIEKSDAGNYKRDTMKFKILGRYPRRGKRWQIGEDTARELERLGKVEIVDGIVKKAVYPEDEEDKQKFIPFWSHLTSTMVGTAQSGKDELKDIFGIDVGFDTVKPTALIKKLIFHSSDKNSFVLDFFAGSGTTMEAVLKQNLSDGGNRKCILCTDNENEICSEITYPRLSKVISGYKCHGASSDEIYRENLTIANIKKSDELFERLKHVTEDACCEKGEIKIEDNSIVIYRKIPTGKDIPPLGGSLKYYKTAFVGKHRSADALDEDRAELAAKAGALLAMAEETLEEKSLPKKQRQYWQWFTNGTHKHTLIYFSDDWSEFESLVETTDKIRAKDKAARFIVYVFAIGSVESFENEFDDMRHITLKPIPEPILAIYRAINGD